MLLPAQRNWNLLTADYGWHIGNPDLFVLFEGERDQWRTQLDDFLGMHHWTRRDVYPELEEDREAFERDLACLSPLPSTVLAWLN